MITDNEELKEWVRTNCSWITQSEMNFARKIWQARQPEIDALKAENEKRILLIERSTDSAINNMLATSKHIKYLNDEMEKLKAENENLRKDAQRM